MEARQASQVVLESRIQAVSTALDGLNASSDERNRVLYPLQAIKKIISAEESIPALFYQREESTKAMDTALDNIEALKPTPDIPKPRKQTKSLRVSSVTTKTVLESTADVEEFIEALKARLLEELGPDVRIRVQ